MGTVMMKDGEAERDETRMISSAENMGSVRHANKHANLVELSKGYKLKTEVIRLGEIILIVLENGSG